MTDLRIEAQHLRESDDAYHALLGRPLVGEGGDMGGIVQALFH